MAEDDAGGRSTLRTEDMLDEFEVGDELSDGVSTAESEDEQDDGVRDSYNQTQIRYLYFFIIRFTLFCFYRGTGTGTFPGPSCSSECFE
jgi:hypothetical protein